MLSDWGKMSLYFFVVGALSRYEWDLFNKFTQQFTHGTTHLSADVFISPCTCGRCSGKMTGHKLLILKPYGTYSIKLW